MNVAAVLRMLKDEGWVLVATGAAIGSSSTPRFPGGSRCQVWLA